MAVRQFLYVSDGELRVAVRAGECDRGVIERREGREDPTSNLTSACLPLVRYITLIIIGGLDRAGTHTYFSLSLLSLALPRARAFT